MNASSAHGPRRRSPIPFAALLTLLSLPGFAHAADYYLKIDSLPGDISEGRFSGWTRLLGLSANALHPPSNPALPPSIATFEFSVTQPPGKTSPLLMQRCASGEAFPVVRLVVLDGPGLPLLRLRLQAVTVASVQVTAGDLPIESISFSYQKIEWSSSSDDGLTGGDIATFDLTSQTGSTRHRLPFRAVLNPPGRPGAAMRLTCPVEAGHSYRVSSTGDLATPWRTVIDWTAEADGISEFDVDKLAPALFLRVEEIE